jgi:hypothetical protein
LQELIFEIVIVMTLILGHNVMQDDLDQVNAKRKQDLISQNPVNSTFLLQIIDFDFKMSSSSNNNQ